MNQLIYPTLAIIASIGLWFLFISPTWVSIQELQVKEAEFDNAYNQARTLSSMIATLDSKARNIDRQDLLNLETLLPSEIDYTRVIKDVASIAENNNVSVQSVSFNDNNKTDSKETILMHELSFEVAAGYESFITFIKALEENLQVNNLFELKFGSQSSEAGIQTNNPNEKIYSLILVFYSYNE